VTAHLVVVVPLLRHRLELSAVVRRRSHWPHGAPSRAHASASCTLTALCSHTRGEPLSPSASSPVIHACPGAGVAVAATAVEGAGAGGYLQYAWWGG
jgi:hypothetical protein